MLDYVPGRSHPTARQAPDTTPCRTVFPWLVQRLAVRWREDLPITEPSLRADLALGFAAEFDRDAVWPEGLYGASDGPRLGLLVRRPAPNGLIAVECRYPRRDAGGRDASGARGLGDLLRDALRLCRAFEHGLPVQVLLCTDEFRSYLAALRPPLRPLRPDSIGNELRVEMPLDALEEAARNRLADLLDGRQATAVQLVLDVLGYAPVGPLHLGMWRVAEARLL